MASLLPSYLTPALYDEAIRRHGQQVYLHRTQTCPCADEDGYVDNACPACGGLGTVVTSKEATTILLINHNPKKMQLKIGQVDLGERQATPQRHIRLAEGDWLQMRQFPVVAKESLTYGAAPYAGDRVNALFPNAVTEVITIRGGVIHTFPAAAYTDPEGRTISPEGLLLWQPGQEPRPGERLSVRYNHFQAYLVHRSGIPMQRGAEGKRLPDKANVKLITRRDVRAERLPS